MRLRRSLNNSKLAQNFALAVLVCVFLLPLNCLAKTLAEYRTGVKAAEEQADYLIAYIDEVLVGEEKDPAYERELLADLRKALPGTEKVEWEGSLVETGNQWLEAELLAFEEETKDWSKRRAILTTISERLKALEAKIDELERPPLSNRSKDEDKQKIAEISRRPEFQKPEEKPESWFEKLQKAIREWFEQNFPRPNVPQSAPQSFQSISFGLQMLLYALVLGFIAFIIYRFAPFFAERFRGREKKEKADRVILGEKLAADEDAQTLFDEAEALARSGNLRGAIRKGYIALLCELSDRKLIGLAQHKTNRDYLRDVRKRTVLYQNMNGLTNSFERHWYGFETTNEADWNEFKQIYQRAVSVEN